MKKIIILLSFLLSLIDAKANDSLFLYKNFKDFYLIKHAVKKGDTFYSLLSFYQISEDVFFKVNPKIKSKQIQIGQEILFPISKKTVITIQSKDPNPKEYNKLFYKILPSETLYAISKKYGNQNPTWIEKKNKLIASQIKSGQTIHLGWISKKPISQQYILEVNKNNIEEDFSQIAFENAQEEKSVKVIEGRGCWQKHNASQTENSFFVLTDLVEKGTFIQVENPMNKRKISAKVLGPLPKTSFTEGSVILISPSVAQKLDILDSEFFLKLYIVK